jgi:hypothetical protein
VALLALFAGLTAGVLLGSRIQLGQSGVASYGTAGALFKAAPEVTPSRLSAAVLPAPPASPTGQAPRRRPPARPGTARLAPTQPIELVGPEVTPDEQVTAMYVGYYVARGTIRVYAMACGDDSCNRPIPGACGAGSLTITAYGPNRANYTIYSGDYAGCTGSHRGGDFPVGVYQALATHSASRQPDEQVYFQLSGEWQYQDASARLNDAGEIPPGY